jgi:hypothetical protein
MNYNQNKKIAQITPYTLIIGVDIAKFKHVARAQDFRGMEFGAWTNAPLGEQLFLYYQKCFLVYLYLSYINIVKIYGLV